MITRIKDKTNKTSNWFKNKAHEVYGKYKNGVMATTVAIASVLSLSSCGDITKKDVYDSWVKTEQLKNAYNRTIDNIEDTKEKINDYKKNIKEIEDSLKNPNLSKEKRDRLEKEKNKREERIIFLDDQIINFEDALSDYLKRHNKAVEDYRIKLAEYEETRNIANNTSTNSTLNTTDLKLKSEEQPFQ